MNLPNCVECGRLRGHRGRGLCSTCYSRHHRAGTLDRYPPLANKDRGDGAPLEDLTYRQVDYWVRRGYLRPAFAQPGSGGSRCWSADERAVAQSMSRLIRAGLTVEIAHAVARSGETKVELTPGIWLTIEGTP